MTSKLERKWRFALSVSAAAAGLTLSCMDAASIERPYHVAQCVVYGQPLA